MCNTVAYGRYSNNSWFQVNQLTGLSVSAVVAKEFLFLAMKENFPFSEKVAQKLGGKISFTEFCNK